MGCPKGKKHPSESCISLLLWIAKATADEHGRQKQIVGLVRTQFLERFESSAHAFA
jgi:hypothetical protein